MAIRTFTSPSGSFARLALLLIAAGLLPRIPWANDIEPSKEFYTASFTAAPIALDGKLAEWAGVPAISNPKFAVPKGSGAAGTMVLFEEYAGGTWTGPDDQSASFQVVYDNANVYFGFSVTDDYHENAANSAWNGDSVQLMVANGDRSTQTALYNYALGGTDDTGYGGTIIMHEAGPGGTSAAITRDPAAHKTYYEIRLPAASVGLAKLDPGTKFGLGVVINDGDKLTPGQRGWGGWGPSAIVFGRSPAETALITLGPRVLGPGQIKVTTLSGSGVAGYADSSNPALVHYHNPDGLAVMSGGNIVVADGWNHLIRLVGPAGEAATFAGQNAIGWVDGPGSAARFNYPLSLCLDAAEDILVTDTENNAIRKVGKFGLRRVSTVAGSGVRGLRNGAAAAAQFNFPNDIAVDRSGNIFVTEFQNHTVRKIAPNGAVTTFAGTGQAGYRDGAGASAQFNQPAGLAIDENDNLFVTEWSNHLVRKITPGAVVTTWAGGGTPGLLNGRGTGALLNVPNGIASDHHGNLYLVEAGNHTVRKIDAQQNVTTVAGLGTPGYRNGDASTALFNAPGGIVVYPDGSLIVSDTLNHVLRRLEFPPSSPAAGPTLVPTLNPALTIYGPVGKHYRIEAAEGDTATPDWTAVGSVTLTSAAQMWFDPQPATRRKRLYRAVEIP